MDNWLDNIVDDVDSLHVAIDNLNDLLVGFCFIRNIDIISLIDDGQHKKITIAKFLHKSIQDQMCWIATIVDNSLW
jgi:hypothetical protein